MGKTKKIEEEKQSNIVKEVKLNSSTPILYRGSVQVQVKKGNRIISNKTKRNSGSTQMFAYLGYCLFGELKPNLAPNYIVLLKQPESIDAPHIILSTTKYRSEVSLTPTEDGEFAVTKKFLIPYNAIINKQKCDEIVLTNVDNIQNFSSTSISSDDLKQFSSAIITLNVGDEIMLNELGLDDAIIILWSMQIADISQGGNS